MTGAKICKKNTLNSMVQSILPEAFKHDIFLTIFSLVIFYVFLYFLCSRCVLGPAGFNRWMQSIRQLIFCFRTRIYGSPYENTFFLTFINPEHVIYDIGTEILCKTCFGHNSTQNAPKSINPVRFYTVFCVDSESAIKTRFKALFKNWPSWIRCYRFL